VLVGDRAQPFQERGGSDIEASLALDRFDDERSDASRVDVGLEKATTPGRPVKARAILIAFSTASAPVVTNIARFSSPVSTSVFSRSASAM
jgi:hypothetical protein